MINIRLLYSNYQKGFFIQIIKKQSSVQSQAKYLAKILIAGKSAAMLASFQQTEFEPAIFQFHVTQATVL